MRYGKENMDIYVGNLPYTANEADIREIFAEFGDIQSVKVVLDRETGQSKGFGFVTLADQSRVNEAVGALNGRNLNGRALRVNASEPRPATGGFGSGSYSGGGSKDGGGRNKRNTGW
ncbi:RNA-binding protein [Luteolibacter sp. SL250]|uniref:RNA recognition motif domain-containing protein n=1 Tax=Luteolibacter sp. SL250 TaxID=2995170 RepID=UPI0022709A62|nr:RNA-binding protein [Luteolibacter sp. SL250]WAC19040.1 RNA-binding protein [Luteolibacter sp. SL250]